MNKKNEVAKEVPKRETGLDTMLKLKAAYDLHTIAEDVRAKKTVQDNEIFQNMIRKIDFDDYCGYLEKFLYPKYLYQKEKGGRNFLIVMIIVTGLMAGAFTVLPVVKETIFSAVLIYIVAIVFMYKNFLGIYNSYKDIWKNGSFENSDEAFSKLMEDAKDKSTGIGYDISRKMTIPRENAEFQKASKRFY